MCDVTISISIPFLQFEFMTSKNGECGFCIYCIFLEMAVEFVESGHHDRITSMLILTECFLAFACVSLMIIYCYFPLCMIIDNEIKTSWTLFGGCNYNVLHLIFFFFFGKYIWISSSSTKFGICYFGSDAFVMSICGWFTRSWTWVTSCSCRLLFGSCIVFGLF